MNNKNLWWEGPIFLKEQDIFENKDVIEIDIIEEKSENTFVCLSDIKGQVDLNEVLNFNKYSNFGGVIKGLHSALLREKSKIYGLQHPKL